MRQSGDDEERHPVDAAATLPDGHTIDGAAELANYLIERKNHEFARALTSKLLTFALGRSLELEDEKTVEELTSKFIADRYRLRGLITMIVSSEPFRGS